MPLFVAILTYSDDTERLQRVRPSHREYLRGLLDQGKIHEAGPFTDDSGAVIIYEANELSEVQEMLTNDPFAQNGIIQDASIREWKIVLARDEGASS